MIATKCVKVVSNATIATCVLFYSCLDIYIIVSGIRERTNRGDIPAPRGGHQPRKKGSAGREQHHLNNAGYYGGRRGTGGQDKGAKTKY